MQPNDASILDSLGWVQFKRGQIAEAVVTLEKAYALRRDPEIAAHLGEVMWVLGRRDEALALWRGELARAPAHRALTEMMSRYAK